MVIQVKKESPENLNGNRIDAIKELVFGENIQEYDSGFKAVRDNILSKKKELEHLIEDVKSELMQRIDSLSTDLNIRITDLENSMTDNIDKQKVDRKPLSNLFNETGTKNW